MSLRSQCGAQVSFSSKPRLCVACAAPFQLVKRAQRAAVRLRTPLHIAFFSSLLFVVVVLCCCPCSLELCANSSFRVRWTASASQLGSDQCPFDSGVIVSTCLACRPCPSCGSVGVGRVLLIRACEAVFACGVCRLVCVFVGCLCVCVFGVVLCCAPHARGAGLAFRLTLCGCRWLGPRCACRLCCVAFVVWWVLCVWCVSVVCGWVCVCVCVSVCVCACACVASLVRLNCWLGHKWVRDYQKPRVSHEVVAGGLWGVAGQPMCGLFGAVPSCCPCSGPTDRMFVWLL